MRPTDNGPRLSLCICSGSPPLPPSLPPSCCFSQTRHSSHPLCPRPPHPLFPQPINVPTADQLPLPNRLVRVSLLPTPLVHSCGPHHGDHTTAAALAIHAKLCCAVLRLQGYGGEVRARGNLSPEREGERIREREREGERANRSREGCEEGCGRHRCRLALSLSPTRAVTAAAPLSPSGAHPSHPSHRRKEPIHPSLTT